MAQTLLFFLNSLLFGVGLAMDAFSVSMANGLREPHMGPGRMCRIAGTFALFQILMPLLGWAGVRTVASAFALFHKLVPWIALALLVWIGGGMLREGLQGAPEEAAGDGTLLMQGVATSIDALSVGFTMADYAWAPALGESLIIGAVTFVICLGGVAIGKAFGTRLAGKASVLGGVILIAIGLEIFISGVLR